MTGVEWTDQVCVTAQACLNDFEFFLIHEQSGLIDPIDGVLGLARNNQYYLSDSEEINRGPSYMLGMVNANLIS